MGTSADREVQAGNPLKLHGGASHAVFDAQDNNRVAVLAFDPRGPGASSCGDLLHGDSMAHNTSADDGEAAAADIR